MVRKRAGCAAEWRGGDLFDHHRARAGAIAFPKLRPVHAIICGKEKRAVEVDEDRMNDARKCFEHLLLARRGARGFPESNATRIVSLKKQALTGDDWITKCRGISQGREVIGDGERVCGWPVGLPNLPEARGGVAGKVHQ